MKIRRGAHRALITVLSAGVIPCVVGAAESSSTVIAKVASGTIVGVVTDSAKRPVARATITASRLDGSAIRATISASDGVYSFADLAPGEWSLTVQVDGYADSVERSVLVAASKSTRHDVAMPGRDFAQATPLVAATPPPKAQTVPLGLIREQPGSAGRPWLYRATVSSWVGRLWRPYG
jgi:hypothetical protein